MDSVNPIYSKPAKDRKPFLKKAYVSVAGIAGAFLLLTSLAGASNLSIGGPSDCDNNAVINCGAHSVNQLIASYNQSAYVRAVYASFGISRADVESLSNTAVAGTVTKQGDVYAGGRLVAKDAITGGRQDMPGSTRVNANGAIFYRRPPASSFASDSLPAFVSMSNGRFQFAIIASCGNAVSATAIIQPQVKTAVAPAKPVATPPKHKHHKPQQQPAPVTPPPAPAQTPTQTQTQTQQVNQQVTVQNNNVNNNQNQVSTPATTPTPTPTPTPAPTVATTAPVVEQAPAQTEVASTPAATTTQTLPNTGPGDVIGLFTVASTAGFLGYRRFLARKFG